MPLSRLCAALWLLLPLLELTLGEMAPGSQCSSGQSWSSDLGKCRDCNICGKQPKNDFCTSCSPDLPPKNEWLWPIVGSVGVGVFTLIVAFTAFLLVRRCKKKEKFTTPIEETGGHSAEDALIH